MEVIFMEIDTDKIILNINDNKITGHIFHSDNTVDPIDKSILNYFDFLKLSSNYTRLPDEDDYHIYLDNETNYKHYFKNGVEDYKMFYLNNGEDATVYDEKDGKRELLNKIKKFVRKNMTVFLTMEITIALLTGIYVIDWNNRMMGPYEVKEYQPDVTLEEVRDLIYASPIEDKYKDFLYEEEYYKIALPEINQSNFTKKLFRDSTTNLEIKFEELDWCKGYYQRSNPNVLHISTKLKDTDAEWNTILHERKHSEQGSFRYSMFHEALAEIISYEFNELCYDTSYSECIQAVRELIEIIGPEPLWHFHFSGDAKKIFESVEPYLTVEEFMEFKYCISTAAYANESENKAIINSFNDLLKTLAKNKQVGYDPRLCKDKVYFNTKDIREKLEENEMYLWDLCNSGLVTIYKYDDMGNRLGEATYDDLLTQYDPRYQNMDDNNHYEIEYKNKDLGWFGAYVLMTRSEKLLIHPMHMSIENEVSYEEYASKHQEEIDKNTKIKEVDAYYNYYKEIELHYNNRNPIIYQDGSKVEFLENDVVKRTDKSGKETIYEVPKGVKVNVYCNGFITWESPDGFCYRNIFPNGVVLEKRLLEGEDNSQGYRYYLSTGDIFDVSKAYGNTIRAHTDKNGNKKIALDGYAFIDQFDENGNKTGVMRFSHDYVQLYDLEGTLVFQSKISDDTFCDMIHFTGETSYEAFNKYGIIAYNKDTDWVTGFTYPNGYSVKFENGVSIYDPNGLLVTTVNKPNITGIDYDSDGKIIIIQDHRIFTNIYFGKYMVEYDENNKPINVTNFENMIAETKDI